jgi:general stress protein YciG
MQSKPDSKQTLPDAPTGKPSGRSRRGFAAMAPEKVREIASKGGKAAHEAGTAHTFSKEEAQIAGKKGGMAPHKRRGRAPASAPLAKGMSPSG